MPRLICPGSASEPPKETSAEPRRPNVACTVQPETLQGAPAMAQYRDQLPQLDAAVFLTDGGIETTLIFDDGLDLPDFAAFTLLPDEEGRAAIVRYFDRYAEIAQRDGVGIVLETPTWRANPDWAKRQGYSAAELDAANRDSVDLVLGTRDRWERDDVPVVVSGCIGPRGDGYSPDSLM